MSKKRRCKKCSCLFEVNPRNPAHRYCRKKGCQQARKSKWQRNKMATDEDYRLNQAAAGRRWREKNRDYWKKYRSRNQEYTCKNREAQKQRNRRRTAAKSADGSILAPIAKMDASKPENTLFAGTYRLIPVLETEIAKMDALIVKIDPIPNGYAHNRGSFS